MRAVFILLKVEPGHLRSVADSMGELDLCSEIYSVAGDFDLLAKVYVESFDELADVVTDRIQKIPHLRETKSILTFRTYKDPASSSR
ncbi:MAG: Lrp/AsnC ligand binding domain-containing protein [Candidatus Binatia bacterium]